MTGNWLEWVKELLEVVAGGLEVEIDFKGLRLRVGTGKRAEKEEATHEPQ
jgi:hypothetical protein